MLLMVVHMRARSLEDMLADASKRGVEPSEVHPGQVRGWVRPFPLALSLDSSTPSPSLLPRLRWRVWLLGRRLCSAHAAGSTVSHCCS